MNPGRGHKVAKVRIFWLGSLQMHSCKMYCLYQDSAHDMEGAYNTLLFSDRAQHAWLSDVPDRLVLKW